MMRCEVCLYIDHFASPDAAQAKEVFSENERTGNSGRL